MPFNINQNALGFNEIGDIFKLPFQEQIDFFRNKINLPTQYYDDILKESHDRAFIVAGAAKADLLNDLRGAVDRSIAEGKSINWFRQEFFNIVDKHGWTGWTGEETKAGRDWRTRVIYRTNMASSYAAGRWAQLKDPDLLKRRPYWKYVHNDTVLHPRPLHLSWDGLVLRHDDPWWQTHFPPNGWGCRCRVTAVRADQYTGQKAPDDGTYEYIDRHGEAHRIPQGIDYGWDYAPGASISEGLRDQVIEKSKDLPKALAVPLKEDIQQEIKKVFQPQQTAKLAAKWAMENDLVDLADYGNIHPDVANAMNESLFNHLQEFPELRDGFKFIGTTQKQYERAYKRSFDKYVTRLMEKGASYDSASFFAKRNIKKPKVNGSLLASSLADPDLGGIGVNEKFGKDLPGLFEHLKRNVDIKFHPIGADTIRSMFDHELGHQLDALLQITVVDTVVKKDIFSTEIGLLYKKAMSDGMTEALSKYAASDIEEFLAEAWSEYLNNPNPRFYAREVGRIVKEAYAQKYNQA